jgi:hypothetical protein
MTVILGGKILVRVKLVTKIVKLVTLITEKVANRIVPQVTLLVVLEIRTAKPLLANLAINRI